MYVCWLRFGEGKTSSIGLECVLIWYKVLTLDNFYIHQGNYKPKTIIFCKADDHVKSSDFFTLSNCLLRSTRLVQEKVYF
jgi:hypothetical protein